MSKIDPLLLHPVRTNDDCVDFIFNAPINDSGSGFLHKIIDLVVSAEADSVRLIRHVSFVFICCSHHLLIGENEPDEELGMTAV